MLVYERQLDADLQWAFQEGSMHFEKESAVHKTLRRIAARLDELSIPYAIAGGMALFFHGYRRFTEDVDIVLTDGGLARLHAEAVGRGYLPVFQGSRGLRDTQSGVRIEFLVTGDYPGDGKPKPVAFPEPGSASIEMEGLRFLGLPQLVELKLASGMTNPRRARDLADVQELIAILHLGEDFAEQIHPYVRDKYCELWRVVQEHPA
jgi:hypothetical protein